MNELNEKLAELCGYYQPPEPDGYWWRDDGNMGLERYIRVGRWNPTTDLNQLKMCYEVAEKDHPIVFWAMYWAELKKLFSSSLIEENAHCATAWVKHPELVAQAILKAKGVS